MAVVRLPRSFSARAQHLAHSASAMAQGAEVTERAVAGIQGFVDPACHQLHVGEIAELQSFAVDVSELTKQRCRALMCRECIRDLGGAEVGDSQVADRVGFEKL